MSESVNNSAEVSTSKEDGMVPETISADPNEIDKGKENINSNDVIEPVALSNGPSEPHQTVMGDVIAPEPSPLEENKACLESPDSAIEVSKSSESEGIAVNSSELDDNLPQIEPHTKRGPSDLESSDEGSEYKDAVNPTSPEDHGSDIDSNVSDHSENGLDEPRRNRRSTNTGSKGSESDRDSDGRSEFNESEPSGTRESGDGEEKGKEKVLDRDEDKKDPQYIPKKGMFYEHDDRTCDGMPSPVKEEVKDKKKKFVADKVDRWGHDMFDVQKQSPKTAQDLIDFYGYDIRNEEEAPKAWRSRRYGRGPNKYTRNWQDEAAYHGKRGPPPPKPPPKVFKKKDEDFPTVEESRSYPSRGRGRGRAGFYPNQDRDRINERNHVAPRERQEQNRIRPPSQPETPLVTQSYERRNVMPQEESPPPTEPKSKEVVIEKSNVPSKKKAFSSKPKLESDAEADIAALSKKFSNAVINIGRDGKILPIGGLNNIPKDSVIEPPPEEKKEEVVVVEAIHHVQPVLREPLKEKMSKHEGKSKRYSSQRQRSLPQPGPIQPQQPQQQFMHQQSFSFEGEAPPIYHGAPPPAVYPDGLVFLPPGYQAPAPPPPHLINYSLPPPPQQYGLPMPAPPDLFPTQPGITYYSPTQQPPPPRQNTSRKGKFAIPIIAPDQIAHES